MTRRAFLTALAGVLSGLTLPAGRRAARAARAAQTREAEDELVLVGGWIVRRSQAPKGSWAPAP